MATSKDGWKSQCTAKRKSDGARCTRPPLAGLKVCRMHGGATKTATAIASKARMETKVRHELTRMERLTQLIPETDPEARGDVALVTELRRTVNRIRILDEWIQELGERSVGWGIKTREIKTMTGFPGEGRGDESYDSKTFEARMNVYYAIQLEERKHLLQIGKVWIAAGFKARELDLAERQVVAYNNALLELCAALGHDPADPGVRAIVHRVMLGLAQQTAAIES